MSLTLSTAPASEPVTLAEVKARLDIDTSDNDTELTALALAARQWAEEYTWSQFITATWTLKMDYWESVNRLPRGPVQSVTSVTYIDQDGNSQTLASSQYQVVIGSSSYICPAYNVTWPVLRSVPEAVTVTYVTGYGDDATDVPEPVRQAIIVMAAAMYHGCTEAPLAAKALLSPYRITDTRVTAWLA